MYHKGRKKKFMHQLLSTLIVLCHNQSQYLSGKEKNIYIYIIFALNLN